MGRDRAAYMRDYRARHKPEVAPEPVDPLVARLRARILDLQEEVRHLKAELARRPQREPTERPLTEFPVVTFPTEHQFSSRPFTPAPKSGRSR